MLVCHVQGEAVSTQVLFCWGKSEGFLGSIVLYKAWESCRLSIGDLDCERITVRVSNGWNLKRRLRPHCQGDWVHDFTHELRGTRVGIGEDNQLERCELDKEGVETS
jgi:hypothetical protein